MIYLSTDYSKAATPGNTLPSMYSSNAPPPVETYDTFSPKPRLLIAEAESPPPINENPPFSVAFTTALAMDSVPVAKLGNSNTPIGPFHIIVLEDSTTLENSSIDFGPMSSPSHASGMLPFSTIFLSASL